MDGNAICDSYIGPIITAWILGRKSEAASAVGCPRPCLQAENLLHSKGIQRGSCS
jgi:hypothetical protein